MNRPPGPYRPDNSGLYPINVNGKYGFMDRAGRTVITPQFDQSFMGFSESLAAVQVGTKWGYINVKGVVVITPQFEAALPFRYGRARVRLGNRWGFIDKDGKYIGSPTFLWATEFSGDFAPVQTSDRVFALVDRSGKIVLLDKVEQLQYGFTEGLMAAAFGGKWGFIDTVGKWVVDPQFELAWPFEDGLAPVRVGGRWGYVDRKGKFVINPQYDSPEGFHDGYTTFGSGGRFGFIDTKGRVAVDAKFLEAYFFSDGLAPVKTEDGWGYINPTGKMVVSPQFDGAFVFQNGLARVTVSGKEAYITTTGAFVVDPFPGRAGIPVQPVQEIWESPWTGTLEKPAVRFILTREGAQIRGYSFPNFVRGGLVLSYDLKGQAAKDGSFSMADQNGTSWKGQFVSSVLIEGVQTNPLGYSEKKSPMRLRLVRDATAGEVAPLPPTSSDWSAFLSSFKDAVQRRDFGVLSHMTIRRFFDENSFLVSRPPASAQIEWTTVDGALVQGVESSSSTPSGRATRLIVGGGPQPPNPPNRIRLTFIQDVDNQWRWARFDYPDAS
jgi:hypothetical protein